MLLLLVACTVASSPIAPGDPSSDDPTTTSGRLPGTNPEEADDADGVFATDRVAEIELTLPRAEWADIRDNPGAESWHTADFRWNDEVVENVAVRAFGQGSVVPGKPPLKIDFDRAVEGQDWHGLEQLKLDSSTQDAGFLNEVVGTWVLRQSDLPAARTGFARLTVNGDPAGFFVVLEPIDDQFLQRWYGEDAGALYSIGTWRYAQGLNPITWGTVLDWYEPQTSVGGDGAEILAAIEATAVGSDDDFLAKVDTETFTRIAVARASMGAIDSFAADGNNFYLYDHLGQLTPIAWDLDADLGYPYYFDNALFMGLVEPWLWSHARANPVTGEVYDDPVHARMMARGWDVDGYLAKLLTGALEWEALDAQVAEWAATIEDAACEDTYHSCTSFRHRVIDLRFFLHTRLSLLAGTEVATCEEADPSGAVATVGTVLEDSSPLGPGLLVGGEHACHGLFATPTAIVRLPVEEGNLELRVGIHDANLNSAPGARVSVVQGGSVLWSQEAVLAYDAPVAVSVPVEAGEVELRSQSLGGEVGGVVWAFPDPTR